MKNIERDVLDLITPDIRKEMERIWFTADLHHGHPKIVDICSRPTTRENLTEWLVREVINKYVGKNDEIYFLGDLSMAKRSEAEKFIDRLNGNKFLITGNHDKNIKNSTRFIQIIQRKRFTFKRDNLKIEIILDHYPIISWDKRIHGSWHLYGHVHGRNLGLGRSFDVGIDNPRLLEFTGGVHRPINLYEVCMIMKDKPQYSEVDNLLSTYDSNERDDL